MTLRPLGRGAFYRKIGVTMHNDEYELYDLKVEVISSNDGKPMVCQHLLGDYFTVTDDDLIEFPPGVRFPMFSLAAMTRLFNLPA